VAPRTPGRTATPVPPARCPSLDPSIKELILRLGRENPRWGYLRIRGELLKLGVDVSHTTIATVLRRGRLGPTWSQFLRLQAYALLSPDFRSEEGDDLEDLAPGGQEAPAPVSEDPATSDPDDPIHDDPSRPHGQPIATVAVNSVPPHARTRARDGPAASSSACRLAMRTSVNAPRRSSGHMTPRGCGTGAT